MPFTTRIAVVGDNTIDRFLNRSIRDVVGGNALNVAAQLALAGENVEYFGAVGDDELGTVIRAAIVDTGLADTHVRTMRGATAVTDIRVLDDGDRVFEREEFGVTAEYFPTDEEIDELARSGWVHLGMQPQAGRLRAEIRRRNPRTRISQDLAVSPGLDDLDVAFSSGVMLDGRAPAEVIREHLAFGLSASVVTLGADGCIAGGAFAAVMTYPAGRVDVVDATGAGDSFIAGFIARSAHGAPLAESIRQGTDWAATTCGHLGGWPQ